MQKNEWQNQVKLNGFQVYQALRSGAAEVIKNKAELNRINVFPVADGDTGSNLAATMKGILEHTKESMSIGAVMNSAADGALISARGNSGIIFAQFIYGFHMAVKDQQELSLEETLYGLNQAMERLHGVVMNPVEGTILTVIRSWIKALETRKHESADFTQYMTDTLADCEIALKKTTEQMDILKARQVVDSGAKGFYHFLEGIHRFVKTGEVPVVSATTSLIDPLENRGLVHEEKSEHRYCCETILRATKGRLDVEKIRKRLALHGDSLIIAGGEEIIRVHVHSDDPEEMFGDLASFGVLDGIKVDDMHLQIDVMNHRLSEVAIVTDSIADLPEGFCEAHQIFMIPLQLDIDGVTHLDRITMSIDRFYQINHTFKEHPKSSLPPIKNVENLLNFLADHYAHIIVLSVSDRLSGTYGMISSVAEMVKKRGTDIAVINTKKNSGAQGLIVKRIAELAEQGTAFTELVNEAHRLIPRTKILVAVDTVKYLERSGRVSRQAGWIAGTFNLKPIMTLDEEGAGKAYGGAISFNGVMKKIVKQVTQDHKLYGVESFSIVHAANAERAELMASAIEAVTGIKNSYIAAISPIVGATAGEGATAVSYVLKDRPSVKNTKK